MSKETEDKTDKGKRSEERGENTALLRYRENDSRDPVMTLWVHVKRRTRKKSHESDKERREPFDFEKNREERNQHKRRRIKGGFNHESLHLQEVFSLQTSAPFLRKITLNEGLVQKTLRAERKKKKTPTFIPNPSRTRRGSFFRDTRKEELLCERLSRDVLRTSLGESSSSLWHPKMIKRNRPTSFDRE
jgi:hypothetical protein